MFVCVRVCLCACVHACVRACVCACVRTYQTTNTMKNRTQGPERGRGSVPGTLQACGAWGEAGGDKPVDHGDAR